MFFYKRKNGEVVMRSESPCECDTLIEFKYDPSEVEKDLMNRNYLMVHDGEKLVFSEQPAIVEERKVQTAQDLQIQLTKATTIDELKIIVESILHNI